MRRHHPLLLGLLAVTVLAVLTTGCGSSDGDSGYGSRTSSEDSPTATATTPTAPPGASAQACTGAGSGAEQLRVTGIDCDAGLRVVAAWAAKPSCSEPAGSRFSCSVDGGYRCLGANVERGIAVSCGRPGASASFIAKPN